MARNYSLTATMRTTTLLQVMLLLGCCQSALASSSLGDTFLTFRNANFAFARYPYGKQDHRVTGSLRDFDWDLFCMQCAPTEEQKQMNFHHDVVLWFKDQTCIQCGVEVLAQWVWEHNGTGIVEVDSDEVSPGRHARISNTAGGTKLVPVDMLMGEVIGLTAEMFSNKTEDMSFIVVGTGNEWIPVFDTYWVLSSTILSIFSVNIIALASFKAYIFSQKKRGSNRIAPLLVMILEIIANICRLLFYVDPLFTQGRYGYALGRFLVTLSSSPAFLSIVFVALTLSEKTSKLMSLKYNKKNGVLSALGFRSRINWGKWKIMIAISFFLVVEDLCVSSVMAFTQFATRKLRVVQGLVILLEQAVVGVYFWTKCSKVIKMLRMTVIQPQVVSTSKEADYRDHSSISTSTNHTTNDLGPKPNPNHKVHSVSSRLERMSRLVRVSVFFMASFSAFSIVVSLSIGTEQPIGHWFLWNMVFASVTGSSYLRVISFQIQSKYKTRLYQFLSCERRPNKL